MPFVVEQVTPGVTYRLRATVLRPGRQVSEMALPGDDVPSAAHFAAYDVRGPDAVDEIIGVATVFAEDEPESGPARWRLRGMATAPEARRQGVGAALLERVVAHVDSSGGGGLWANARVGALEFYRAAGFLVVSGVFDSPPAGLHRRVRRA